MHAPHHKKSGGSRKSKTEEQLGRLPDKVGKDIRDQCEMTRTEIECRGCAADFSGKPSHKVRITMLRFKRTFQHVIVQAQSRL